MPDPGNPSYYAYYSRKIEELRQKHGGRCIMCGAKYSRVGKRKLPLEFAHLKHTGVNGKGRGIARRYHDILKNYATSYVLLCKSCHRELDNFAPMVKPADTGDLKSPAEKHVGSSPTGGTNWTPYQPRKDNPLMCRCGANPNDTACYCLC